MTKGYHMKVYCYCLMSAKELVNRVFATDISKEQEIAIKKYREEINQIPSEFESVRK